MKEMMIFNRRDFLATLGLSAAGLCLGSFSSAADALAALDAGNGLNPNVFIHVADTGIVTIVCHRSEMGQGIRSSLPVLLADELGASMKQVKIVQADGDKKYGDQNTDGSKSIRGIYDLMRNSAATVRMMLTEAAAQRWKVSADKLYTENNFVILRGTNKKLSFAELANEAGKLAVPDTKTVKMRPNKEMKNLGKDLPLLDGPAYVTGTAQFGADVKIPNMLIAVIARPAVVSGTVKRFNTDKAKKVKGVVRIVEMPKAQEPYHFQPWGGIAVLAENTWAAIRGREELEITWDRGTYGNYESKSFKEALIASATKGGTVLRKKGDFDGALKLADKVVEAQYYVPHLPHAPMEPPVSMAHFKKDEGTCEVWVPSQHPQAARTEIARVLGISEDKVTVHVTFLGGGFGRKSKADFSSEAAWLSREVGQPVRVQFTREDDLHNDYLNTVNAQILTAGLDKSGQISAWRVKTAYPPITSVFTKGANTPAMGDLQQGILDLALNAPNVEAQACEANAHIRTGWLRSVYNIFHGFATNSFLDEIAHAVKKDPLEVMLDAYADKKMSFEDLGIKELRNYGEPIEKYPVNGERLRNVLEKVAKNADWKNRSKKKNRGYGIAAHRSFLSYVAVVAAVVKDQRGQIQVEEAWIVIDAGLVVNTDRARAQMEGSVINGMTYFFNGGVTHKDGAVVESNFDEAPLIAIDRAPKKIHVEIVKSDELPGGVGEPGVPPTAPAIANAVFALTGQRIREFASTELQGKNA